jgi:succinoglycan biosynthesis transport protein ExoP
MDLIYLIRAILKKKWIILLSGTLAAVIVYILTLNEPKKYRSTAQVTTGFAISDEIKINDNFSFIEADTKFNNAIVTLTSPSVLTLVSYKLLLHDLQTTSPFRQLNPEKNKPLSKEQKEKLIPFLKAKTETMGILSSFKKEEREVIETLQKYGYDYKSLGKNLVAYRLERTDYIQIDFVSENPELSAFVVNNIYEEFLRYYQNVRSSKSRESIDTLYSLLEKKKTELDKKNDLLRAQGVSEVGLENNSNLELILSTETALSDEKSRKNKLEFDLQKVEQRLSALPSDGKPGPRGNDELVELRKAMNEAYSQYVNTGSTDQAQLEKYNRLKKEYQSKVLADNSSNNNNNNNSNERKRVLQNEKNDIQLDIMASQANIDVLSRKLRELKSSLINDASKSALIESMLKDVELANKEYLEAKQRYNEAIDINSSSVNNFRQVLVGQPAIEPEPSKRILFVGMAGFAGIIGTILIVILLAYLDTSVKTPGIFSKTVNLKLISMVNYTNLKAENLQDIIGNKINPTSTVEKERMNIFRESVRKLRYEIEKSGKKIFMFTSTKKGQGKTTLIQALSFSLSRSNKKVLIIDTNFCNNDLTIQLNADPILEKINHDEVSTDEKLLNKIADLAKDVSGGSVFAIGSEGGDYTPSEILPRENLLNHLNILQDKFDYIFLEGPPLNDFTDSRELSEYVHGVIAVFSAKHIIKQIDLESVKFFRELDSKFIGSVLNMVDLENVTST